MDVTSLIAVALGWNFTVGVFGQQRTRRDQVLEYQNRVRILQRIHAFTEGEQGKTEKMRENA